MRNGKLRLNLEELSVESFSPAEQEEARGTVRGAEATVDAASGCFDCAGTFGQAASCAWTYCQNLSCLAGDGCGSGGASFVHTCDLRCQTTTPPPIE